MERRNLLRPGVLLLLLSGSVLLLSVKEATLVIHSARLCSFSRSTIQLDNGALDTGMDQPQLLSGAEILPTEAAVPDPEVISRRDSYFLAARLEGCPPNVRDPDSLDKVWELRTNRTSVSYPESFHNASDSLPISTIAAPEMGPTGLVAYFKGAIIGGFDVCVFDCNIMYRQGGCSEPCLLENFKFRKAPVIHVSKGLLLHQKFGNNVYHFMMESFVRITFFPPEVLADPSVRILVSPSGQMSNYLFLFDFFGVNTSRITEIPFDNVIYAEELAVPAGSTCGNSRATALIKLYETVHAKLDTIFPEYPLWKKTFGQVCLIERKVGGLRSIKNTDEILVGLSKAFPTLDFVVYHSYDSTKDIVRRFSSSQYFIGPHGAGWVNMLFAHRDAKVLEIFAKGFNRNYCHLISMHHLGQSHFALEADAEGGELQIMRPNVSEVISMLGQMTGLKPRVS